MDPTDDQALAKALAETYTYRSSDASSWERVQQYRRVRHHQARYPSDGAYAIASDLGVPRSRVRTWVRGGKPDPARAIETARSNGWLDCAWRSDTLAGLTALVAWTFSGGCIDETGYVPAWTWDRRTRDDLAAALRLLTLAPDTRHTDADDRAAEVLPGRDGSVLGRLLVALGAPTGSKSPDASPDVPDYLFRAACPHQLRLDFARVIVRNRGVERPDRPETPVQLAEERSPDYHARLRRFLGDVVGDRAQILGGPDSDVTFLTERAAGVLCPPPTLGEWLADRE